ncbi:MAC/perforin domain-containing protein [Nocardia niigatensis]
MVTAVVSPGADTIGYGLDVFGKYDATSKLGALFQMDYDPDDPSKRFEIGGRTYLVPRNVSYAPASLHEANSNSFSSRDQVQEHFAAKLGLSGKYNFFSGQFSAEYSQSTRADADYSYGLVEAFSQAWTLNLLDTSANALAGYVKSDQDFINIPDHYTDSTRSQFFDFFQKYGTYFISRVTVGSRLHYSCSVLNQHSLTERQIKANIHAEYRAVFAKAGAEAQTEWESLGERWTDQREVHISAIGGDNDILTAISLPDYGQNYHNAYTAWLKSAEQMPAVIDFQVKSVAELFSGEKARAVKQAAEEFVRARLFLTSKTGGCRIAFNGHDLLPQGCGDRISGFQLAAIDRSTLQVYHARSYEWRFVHPDRSIFDNAFKSSAEYHNDRFIICFVTWSAFGSTMPTGDLYNLLASCGAGEGLSAWKDLHDLPLRDGYSSDVAHCNYILAGIPGSKRGSGIELFRRAGSSDTGKQHWHGYEGWYELPAEDISVQIDLYRQLQGDRRDSLTLMAARGPAPSLRAGQRPETKDSQWVGVPDEES